MPYEKRQDIKTHLGVALVDCLNHRNTHRHCLVMTSKESHDHEFWLALEHSFHAPPTKDHEAKEQEHDEGGANQNLNGIKLWTLCYPTVALCKGCTENRKDNEHK